jgi:Transposase DDE domain
MGQTRDETTRNLTERLCWEVAHRDDLRVARRLYRKQIVDGVYRLDEGAVLDDFVIDAVTKIPLAVKVGKIQEHETHWTRALITQARANLAGYARLHKVVFDKGFLDGTDLWWLDQQGLCFVVPAQANMAVTADARAQAAAGEGITRGRRVHTVRHGQGRAARTERLETEVVGITGLTTYDQYGTPEHGRQHNRRDFQAPPSTPSWCASGMGKIMGLGARPCF